MTLSEIEVHVRSTELTQSPLGAIDYIGVLDVGYLGVVEYRRLMCMLKYKTHGCVSFD